MASDKVGAGGEIEHHRTGFFQLLRQLRRAYLLRLRAGRHLGGWHPAFAQLAGRQRAQPRRLPAHLRQPRAGYRRPDAIVIQQHNARPSYAGEVVGLLHQLAAWRAQAAGIVTRRVLFGAADIKQEGGAVALLQPALQRGLIDDRHPGPFGKMRHLSGPGAGGAGGGSYCRCCCCASVWPASVQPIVPLRRAWTGFGTPALISDWVPMMLRVRPAQLTITGVCGEGVRLSTRRASSPPGTLMLPGMLMVWYSSKRRASTITTSCRLSMSA